MVSWVVVLSARDHAETRTRATLDGDLQLLAHGPHRASARVIDPPEVQTVLSEIDCSGPKHDFP